MEKKDFVIKLICEKDSSSQIRSELTFLLAAIPELKDLIGFEHRHPHHHLDVWEHTLLALSHSKNRPEIRMALLLHDIGKPHCYQQEGDIRHYRGHGEKSYLMARGILKNLGFDANFADHVCEIIKKHDIPLSENDIRISPILSSDIFEVQRCDALAHNPTHNKKRMAYIEKTAQLIGKYVADGECL